MNDSSNGKSLSRWLELENNPDWNGRVDIVLKWLKNSSGVLDVGCGTQYIKTVIGDIPYMGLDIVEREMNSQIINLNEGAIPSELMEKYKTITFIGVLEYLKEPISHLEKAAKYCECLIFTYTPIEFESDEAIRKGNDWVSTLSLEDLDKFVLNCGLSLVFFKQHCGQLIYVLSTKAYDIRLANPVNLVSKKSVVLSGFFGRGNLGDEAILQNIYESLSKEFNIIVSVDQYGAYDGFWDWYPYSQLEIIHQNNLERLTDKDIVGLHVGGGGLPIGFNGGQVAICNVFDKKVLSTGVDNPIIQIDSVCNYNNLCEQIQRFDLFSVRTQNCFDAISGTSNNVSLGADWAIGLNIEESSDAGFNGIYVVIRELPIDYLSANVLKKYSQFIKFLTSMYEVRFLPFCPEDERFLEYLPNVCLHELERQWWNPRKMKEKIYKSQGLVSLGRLHPIIISSELGTPVCGVDLNDIVGSSVGKIKNNCAELGVDYFGGLDCFLENFTGLNKTIISNDYLSRRLEMEDSVKEVFVR
jgi:hypothetical protein